MISKLRFYVRHSFNDLRVNRQRTIFALLCIAAGVAAIVSLQTLGVMIQDSLTGSVQESNGGDLQLRVASDRDVSTRILDDAREQGLIEKPEPSGLFSSRETNEQAAFFYTEAGIERIQTWFDAAYPGTEITYREVIPGGHGPMSAVSINDLRTNQEQMFVAPIIVDAQVYPLYGQRVSEDDQPISELLREPSDIVISRTLADTLEAQIGDTMRLSGSTLDFTLRGILPDDAEGGIENLGGALFGYFMVDLSAAPTFEKPAAGIDSIFVKLPDQVQVEQVAKSLNTQYPFVSTTTTTDLEEQNTEISDTLNDLVTVMGLVSLLIGGIGIINTMQVVVRRRTGEIAILKTVGMEAEQVTILFLVEAVLMGVIGSVIGVMLGWLAAYAIKGFAETFVAESLRFRIALLPTMTGLLVGVVLTAVFGFIPTLAAGQVRPNTVLRPNETVIPTAGRLRSFAALLVVLALLSLVAQLLLGTVLSQTGFRVVAGGTGLVLGGLVALPTLYAGRPRRIGWLALLPMGFAFGFLVPALLLLAGTFIVVAILYALLWGLIWLVGRCFPALRWIDLKVAMRSMVATKGRGASTLLALVIGVFTLSLITMLTAAVSDQLEELLANAAGGNVIIFASGEGETLDQVAAKLEQMDGVNSYTALGTYSGELIAMEDVSTGEIVAYDELKTRVEDSLDEGGFMGHGERNRLNNAISNIDARSVSTNLPDVAFYRGRQLTQADAGQPHLVISANQATLAAGFDVGDKLTYRFATDGDPIEMTFEIVGMIDRTGNQMQFDATSPNYASLDSFPAGLEIDSVSAIVDVDEDQIPQLKREMRGVPGAFVLESRLMNDVFNRFIQQFTSFPLLVASLALVVGGIVIANSVALSTLERRREIGIMKAIGLQRERVLGMLLLENGVMGLIGGLMGIGTGAIMLLLVMVSMFGGRLGSTIPYLTALELMLMCIGIALLAAVLTVWGASGEKPLNVLRYE